MNIKLPKRLCSDLKYFLKDGSGMSGSDLYYLAGELLRLYKKGVKNEKL